MNGILYGVGVGPGDPELMTLKAARLIRENEVIAVPGPVVTETVAYKIAHGAVPEIEDKIFLPLTMTMTMDKQKQEEDHTAAANAIIEYLSQGKNVVYLTLGDPTVYSTYMYVQKRVKAAGYTSQIVSGITSFCAAAARADISLSEWNEPLYVVPAVHKLDYKFDAHANYVLMKSASKISKVKAMLKEADMDVTMVEDCGMPSEKVYTKVDDIPDDASYYSLIIAKPKK